MPTDPRSLADDAPLLAAWLSFQQAPVRSFTIPGHKHNRSLVGDVIAGDVPLSGGLDTVKAHHGLLRRAEQLAAQAWGADHCRFSVSGSTGANQAVMLALGRPGDTVLVGRTLHRSVLSGLVLAGLRPHWLHSDIDEATGLPLGVGAEAVRDGLREAPDAIAVMVGAPTYIGTGTDVSAVAQAAHEHDVPLIVDAAWAAHFGFHPQLPPQALASGADAVVTSAHKTLPAYSQAAYLLARTDRLDPARIDAGMDAVMTTSPAGSILASADAARALLQRDGAQLLGDLIEQVARARTALATIPGVVVLQGPHVDPTKLAVLLPGTGADGIAIEHDLITAGMPLEQADRDTLVAMVTVADGAASVDTLVAALTEAIERRRGSPRPVHTSLVWTLRPQVALSPREAYFASHEVVEASAAVGRVSAELVCPYPPGIPVLAPGEVITAEALAELLESQRAGTTIAYAADPTLASLRVVADGPS